MAATKQQAPVSSSSSAPALATSRTSNGKAKKELDPAVYADLVQARINALEGVESAEDQAEKKSGEWAAFPGGSADEGRKGQVG